MKVKVEKTVICGDAECYKVSNGTVEVTVSVDFGPRIIGYNTVGGKNHMAVLEDDINSRKSAKGFLGFGGHRLWHAPEDKVRSYVPDNGKCVFEILEDGITVLSREDETKLTKGMNIRLIGDSLSIEHFISNEGLFDIELSLWALSQFANGGTLVAPHSTLDTGLIGNRAISLWPYSKMNDKRVYYGADYVTLTNNQTDKPFKFGMTLDEGYAAYFNHNQLVIKTFDYYYGAEYPNYYCNFESYTCPKFTEIESLSPLLTLEAGETAIHSEKWYLFDGVQKPEYNDEKKIKELLEKPLKTIRG